MQVKKRAGRPRFDMADGIAAELFMREGRRIVLSRTDALPLWQQLSNQLENLIYSGKLAPQSRIPSEPALCEVFKVSRPVVRSAISALAAKGLVVKMPRKGMFVGMPPRESAFLTSNLSLFDDMMARGAQISTKTFELEKGPPDDKERDALQLGDGDLVTRLARVFWIDDEPLTYTHMSFPTAKVPGFDELEIEGRSILGMIRDLYGRSAKRAERWFTAAMPTKDAQERLGVPADQPLIWIESIAFEADGTPLEFYRAYYNTSTARIHLSVSD
jgi:GntR family transcriptional regulator